MTAAFYPDHRRSATMEIILTDEMIRELTIW